MTLSAYSRLVNMLYFTFGFYTVQLLLIILMVKLMVNIRGLNPELLCYMGDSISPFMVYLYGQIGLR